MIALVKPDVVFLELCNLRTRLLITDEKNIMAEYEKELSTTEIIESLKKVWSFDLVIWDCFLRYHIGAIIGSLARNDF